MSIFDSKISVGAIAGIVGLILGILYAWFINPVQYDGAGPQDLLPSYQEVYLQSLADAYGGDLNAARVTSGLRGWDPAMAHAAICNLAATPGLDPAKANNLRQMGQLVQNQACNNEAGGTVVEPAPRNWLRWGLGLLLFVLIVGAVFIKGSQAASDREAAFSARSEPELMPLEAPTFSSSGEDGETQEVTPVARFQSTYTHGYDNYDDSFSIETSVGDFLGECGVGISEWIGADSPRSATAFEVWLFDKNDIRTVTKVIMSDHAFYDEAIKAKLAPKGEPVLAGDGDTVVLETASLIINAKLTELDYGSGALPPKSFFERFSVELSAWAKDGDYGEPDVQGRIDEMLNV